MLRSVRPWWILALPLTGSLAIAAEPAQLRGDAIALENIVNENYAYLERLPGGRFRLSDKLRAEAAEVTNPREMVRYSERALALLADHHAITGSSLSDSWAVFPSFGDLWVARTGHSYVIEQVRAGSPAEAAGVRAGDRLLAVDGVRTPEAVVAFWSDLGASGGGERDAYAARVLAAGRRNRPRSLTFMRGSAVRSLLIPNLYSVKQPDRPPVSATSRGGEYWIRFNDSLGDFATIQAFDAAMAAAPRGKRLVIDLRDTPGGGNTTVARAILGWFVDRTAFYQVHRLPAEERRTGIARQWAEQVVPRSGKRYRGQSKVVVGRWTGSMGEGLAIGFDAIGVRVEGSRMAGLLGAVYDHALPQSRLVLKIPTERLYAVDGTPREEFVPQRPR